MKNKGKNNDSHDLLRYKRGEMTNKERNSFEKELQRDPFLAEALGGLEHLNNQIAENDLSLLGKKLRSRTQKKRNLIMYRIAASIAVLMIISSVFIVLERKNPAKEQAIPEYRSVTMDIAKSEPVRKPEEPVPATEPSPSSDKKSTPETSGIAEEELAVSYDMVQKKREEKTIEEKPSVKMAEVVKEPKIPDSNRFLAEEDAMNQPAAAVRYRRKDAATESDAPPRPAYGQEAFDKYIFENIRRPDTSTAGQRVVVVTSFRVRTDGYIDSIKIIKSPGKLFSDEAIRLIKEGPAWKPAIRGGVAVENEIKVRIVFP